MFQEENVLYRVLDNRPMDNRTDNGRLSTLSNGSFV